MVDKNFETLSESHIGSKKLNIPIKVDNINDKEIVMIPDYLRVRLLRNKLDFEKNEILIDGDYRIKVNSLNVTLSVRKDQIIVDYLERIGFDYKVKYNIDDDFSLIHVFGLHKKDSSSETQIITPVKTNLKIKSRLTDIQKEFEHLKNIENDAKLKMNINSNNYHVRQDEMIKGYLEQKGFEYGTKYELEMDFTKLKIKSNDIEDN